MRGNGWFRQKGFATSLSSYFAGKHKPNRQRLPAGVNFGVFIWGPLVRGNPHSLRRVVDAAQLAHAVILEAAFNNLVAKQSQHAATHENWSRVAIPIDAGRAAAIIDGPF